MLSLRYKIDLKYPAVSIINDLNRNIKVPVKSERSGGGEQIHLPLPNSSSVHYQSHMALAEAFY